MAEKDNVANNDEMIEKDEVNNETEGDVQNDEHEHDECKCQEKFVEFEREKAELVDRHLRLRADYENFRRRTRNQVEELKLKANSDLLLDLLPVIDDFERAIAAGEKTKQADSVVEGIKMVYERLLGILGTYGLEKIEAEGELFNPDLHEAVSMAGESDGELRVLNQLQTGYLLNGTVLRHTKVQVGEQD